MGVEAPRTAAAGWPVRFQIRRTPPAAKPASGSKYRRALVIPDLGRPRRIARGDHDVDVIEDRLDPLGDRRFPCPHRLHPAIGQHRPCAPCCGSASPADPVAAAYGRRCRSRGKTRQEVGVDRLGWIVGVAHDDIVAEVAQQRAHLINRRALFLADVDHQRRWNLGLNAIRNRPGSLRAASTNPSAGPGVESWSHPETARRFDRACDRAKTDSPHHASSLGANGIRSRCGFSPNRPHQPDGMRMEPPPSEPSAIGAKPAATAAPLPPLLPPGVSAVFHGLRVHRTSATR